MHKKSRCSDKMIATQNHKAGYANHDSMRAKAMREFGKAEVREMSRHPHISHKRVKRNMGGPLSTAESIQQANNILSNAAAGGLKRGGKVHLKHSKHHADGGAVGKMADRDFSVGKAAAGLKRGGHCKYEMGGEVVKKAIGGAGKVRHRQCTPDGKHQLRGH